jgi:protein gp37
MNKARWHKFQILTKRAERLVELNDKLNWTDNIWMGVSVENDEYTHRVDLLRSIPAKIKFISFEPLLGPIGKCNFQDIDWVIVGGESGPGARPIQEKWIVEIRDNCEKSNVPFFFKQWGGFNKKKAGRLLEGKTWDGMPALEYA